MAQDGKEEVRRRDDTRPSSASSSSMKRLKEPANYCGICQLSFESPQALKDHNEKAH